MYEKNMHLVSLRHGNRALCPQLWRNRMMFFFCLWQKPAFYIAHLSDCELFVWQLCAVGCVRVRSGHGTCSVPTPYICLAGCVHTGRTQPLPLWAISVAIVATDVSVGCLSLGFLAGKSQARGEGGGGSACPEIAPAATAFVTLGNDFIYVWNILYWTFCFKVSRA